MTAIQNNIVQKNDARGAVADAAASPHSPHQINERKGEQEMREGEEGRELVIGKERKGKERISPLWLLWRRVYRQKYHAAPAA